MPTIKPITRRVKEYLQSFGLTVEDLAKSIGRSHGTVVNVLNGSFTSRPTRQLITNFLDCELWPGMAPAPTMLRIGMPTGTILTVPTPDGYAAKIAGLFGAKSANAAGEIVFPALTWLYLAKPSGAPLGPQTLDCRSIEFQLARADETHANARSTTPTRTKTTNENDNRKN